MEGTKKNKSMSFHQYSWNSELETTWISLIGWHHKTSIIYYTTVYIELKFFLLKCSRLLLLPTSRCLSLVYGLALLLCSFNGSFSFFGEKKMLHQLQFALLCYGLIVRSFHVVDFTETRFNSWLTGLMNWCDLF